MNPVRYAIDRYKTDPHAVIKTAVHLGQLAGDLDGNRAQVVREGRNAGLAGQAVYHYIKVGHALSRFMPALLDDPNVAAISLRKWIVVSQCKRAGAMRLVNGIFHVGDLSSEDLKDMKLTLIRGYINHLNQKEYAVDPLHLSKIISYVASLSYLKPAEKSTLTDHLQAVNL